MKIAVIGIGASGSYYACKLSKTNEVITFDNYASKVDEVSTNGINLIEGEDTTNYKVKCFKDGTVLNKTMDLVLVCVKSTQTSEAIKANLSLFGPNTLVLTMQNGLGNIRDIAKYVNPENIVIGCNKANLTSINLNTVKVTGKDVVYFGGALEDKKNALICKVLFTKASMESEVSDNLKKLVWTKAIINSITNPLCALFKCKIKVLYENKNFYDIVIRLIEEGVEIARVSGANLSKNELIEQFTNIVYSLGNSYPSMYHDVQNGKITEIDKLNAKFLTIAYKNQIEIPFNEFIVNSIKGMEKIY